MQKPHRCCQKEAHASLDPWQVGPSTHTHLWAGDIVSLCQLPRTETWHHLVGALCPLWLASSAESPKQPIRGGVCTGKQNYVRKIRGELWEELSVFKPISTKALLVVTSNRTRGLDRSQTESGYHWACAGTWGPSPIASPPSTPPNKGLKMHFLDALRFQPT